MLLKSQRLGLTFFLLSKSMIFGSNMHCVASGIGGGLGTSMMEHIISLAAPEGRLPWVRLWSHRKPLKDISRWLFQALERRSRMLLAQRLPKKTYKGFSASLGVS